VVGALPSTIYVTPNDSLLVSTSERFKITDDEGWTLGEEEVVDIVDLSSFQRITRLPCSFSNEEFTQDFVPWDENGSLVAACSPEPEIISTRPTYSDGIWIIDTATNTIVDSYEILDGPYKSGVESLAVSNSCPGEVFVLPSSYDPSTYERVVIIDHSDGAFIGTINVGSPLRPKFICELPDGRLIVTAGASGKIAIVDPT
jgi:hypothetical protein